MPVDRPPGAGAAALADGEVGRPCHDGQVPQRLTTLDASALHQLPDYISLHDRISADLEAMYDLSGLRHFEGRSFSGWHHHVTLVSVAHAWQYLDPVTVRVGPVV